MASKATAKNHVSVNRHDDEVALDLFNKVCAKLAKSDLKWVADNANVSLGTLYCWLNGDTLLPYSRTFFRVAKTLGFRVTMTETKGFKVPRRLRVVK